MSYKPVDAAITMVVGPAIDDTDFKTLEETIAYNAAGIDVSLIVEKTDGTTAVTAITLTTGGTSDWTHKDGGYYEVEITAAQNIEEGVAYLRGVCTGVLPFESAHYNIVKANVYDSWVKGTDLLQTDLTQIGGVAQSATDLKDFADAGYDPATNKVEGCKVNDDMVGAAPTVTAIRQEMDTNSTKMAPSQTLADYKATGFNTVVPDAAGTAATPAEVATALSNIHLDHLLAADYDPASKPGIATALLNELIESDGGVSRYTANALEQAPSAGTNPNVLIDTTIASVTDQTHFVLTAGSNDDDAYKDQAIVIYDADDSDFPSIRVCSAYTGTTKTITLDTTPDFTIVAGDGCKAFVTAPGTTAPTVGQIRTEMEGAGYKLALIEADTNELQINQSAWATATGFSTHSAADVKTAIEAAGSHLALILADTGELQTDWVNGGRLDLIMDIIAADTTTDIPGLILKYTQLLARSDAAIATDNATELTAINADGGSGAGDFSNQTDGIEAIRDRGDSAWITAAGFSTHSATNVWAVSTRALTDKSGFALSAAGANLILKDSTFALALADAVWDEILTGALHNIVNSAGRRVREIGAYAIESGTAQAATSNSITLAATASADDGVYNRSMVVIVDNTGIGQTRTIVDYNGTTKVAVIDRDWRVTPDATTAYQITADNTPLVVDQGVAQGGTSTTITLRAYASSVNDTYLCNVVAIIAGTGRGQARLVGAYNGTTKVITICGEDWVTTPDTTSIYVMMPYGTTCTSCLGTYALGLINTECDTALTDYAPNTVVPDVAGTAAGLHTTTDGKVDTVQTDSTSIKAKTDNLPSGMAKNVAVPKFDVFMVLSSDHVTGATEKTVTGTISKDGGAFTALTNSIAEVSGGMYTMASGLTQAERNANVSTLIFSANDCDDRIITIISS